MGNSEVHSAVGTYRLTPCVDSLSRPSLPTRLLHNCWIIESTVSTLACFVNFVISPEWITPNCFKNNIGNVHLEGDAPEMPIPFLIALREYDPVELR